MAFAKLFAARSSPRAVFFSLSFISSLVAKSLHLLLHAKSIPLLDLLVFLPTIYLEDVLLIFVQRLLLHGGSGVLFHIAFVVGAFISMFDPAAMKMMASGIVPVSISLLVLVLLSFFATPHLYNKTGACMAAVSRLFNYKNWSMCVPVRLRAKDRDSDDMEGLIAPVQSGATEARCQIWPIPFLAFVIATITLTIVRPPIPYHHLGMTLPVAMLGMISSDERVCHKTGPVFPLPELISSQYWEKPTGEFLGWAPGSHNDWVEKYENVKPGWLPSSLPNGFWRWKKFEKMHDKAKPHRRPKGPDASKEECRSRDDFYNPIIDPLRISNLDLKPYDELQQVFDDSDAVITHVVLLTLESTRKELFPIQKGSWIYNEAARSWGNELPEDFDQKLNLMTRVAQQVTGDRFDPRDDPTKPLEPIEGHWQDYVPPEMGGISVRGAITGSTLSFKSVLGSHCGVGPLTENFLEEVTTKIYQPCLPQIFKLFNNFKTTKDQPKIDPDDVNAPNVSTISHERSSIHQRKWTSVFMQAVTDTYDRQDKQNRQMGFDWKIAKSDLESRKAKYHQAGQGSANYFGYSEEILLPYLRDAINSATANDQRLFLSHFTSSTHHPWNLPEGIEHEEYWGTHGRHVNMNKFFNVNHFSDRWIGKLLDLFQETGIANETLVVIVGDHGQAFEEDSETTGAYQNPHISNFRVPIVFRHPHLPRVQVEANATSIAILPTILDLLVNTNSLSAEDTTAAKHLMHEYEGQSLLRPYISRKNGRQAWNFGIINAGGTMLAVSSAAYPYRLVVPLVDSIGYRFTNTDTDPVEKDPMEAWSISELAESVRKKFGKEAADWVNDADAVSHWWSSERHRLYHYREKE
ncbi:hypothetical protein KEM52_000199 [Ascosphaera acerosa]|nr:hypothetical protein KEM52_000199 [Ascosphaera acerosa]